MKGIEPEIVPSTFDEMLPQDEFENVYEYPVATATQKAVEVYERLVVRALFFFNSGGCFEGSIGLNAGCLSLLISRRLRTRTTRLTSSSEVRVQFAIHMHILNSNSLSLSSSAYTADTVVLTHTVPVSSEVHSSLLPAERPEILEKPISKADNLRMLLDLNGAACEVVTGVSLG